MSLNGNDKDLDQLINDGNKKSSLKLHLSYLKWYIDDLELEGITGHALIRFAELDKFGVLHFEA